MFSLNMVIVSSWKFCFILAFYIDDFKNSNCMSLSTTSVTISNLWLPMIAGILAECMESIVLLFPNVPMLFDCPKENLWWSSSPRLLTYWARHSFLHTVLLIAQCKKAELHVSDVKFLSSFGFWKWLWWRTTSFTMNVFSFSLLGRFCAEWLTLWQMAYFGIYIQWIFTFFWLWSSCKFLLGDPPVWVIWLLWCGCPL